MARNTVARIKAFLSVAFRHAISEGYADGTNPVTLAMIPKRTRPKKETFAYSMAEVLTMMSVVPEDVQVAMMTAALTGLRRSELQGLRWADYHDGAIFVNRSIVDGEVNPPKTTASTAPAPVPVTPALAIALAEHRKRIGSPISGPMFPSRRGNTPASLNNWRQRDIMPALLRCRHCQQAEKKHGRAEHEYERDPAMPVWRGWHGFRRSLATELNSLGTNNKTVQAIVRHAQLSTTMNLYVKALAADSVAAMEQVETKWNALMRTKREPIAMVEPSVRVN